MTIEMFVTKITNKIAYAVGFDTSDDESKARIEMLIESGIADLQINGVPDEVIMDNKIAVVALNQYVMDNLKMVPGEFKTSPVYMSNVQKLRYAAIPVVTPDVG